MVDWRSLLNIVAIPAAQSLAQGRPVTACRMAVLNGHALLRDRLWPNERLAFAGQRGVIRVKRDDLYLQADHATHLANYRSAIATEHRQRKGEFASFCSATDLPHPPTIVLDAVRRPEQFDAVERMAVSSLFVKLEAGSNARGAAVLRRLDDDRWQIRSRTGTAQGRLTQILGRYCAGEALVVQPMLTNAPALAQWAGPSLATFRIVTGRQIDGEIKTLSMLAELPLDDGEPLARSWFIAPVSPQLDWTRATLRQLAAAERPKCRAHLAAFADQAIEYAPILRDLANKAHSLLAETAASGLPPMIGWDLAWTEDGAILLEFNWNWAIAPHYSNSAGVNFQLAPVFRRYSCNALG